MKHARSDGPDLAFRIGRRVVAAVADDMSTAQRVGVGVVGALVALTPFGAWSPAQAQTAPLVTGTAVEVGPFEVTVEKAAVADDLGLLVPEPGNQMLAVVASVTNTGEVPEYSVTLGDTMPAPRGVGIVPEEPFGEPAAETGGEADLPSPTIVNIADGTSRSILNPGVTYRLAFIWEQSGDFAGETVPLELIDLGWVEEDLAGLDDGHWYVGEAAFSGDVPVGQAGPGTEAGQQ
ncbi:hypothetical protein ACFQHV_10545 [Promicromonospora thailandica]|uniref:Uncharacterized protein n=1 Tax=Promicromonospora thailandica TaxID=765201 RepID=A0A9X2G145_9MICO|nr:hypothetical protein [Promicromonospora thailandica]MCP2264914.1 hypothetical protein [Promicromonospora thailandica]BFF18815.1 hypothetical protein GCM10025730_23360 [Promicromonospora thailandica]